MTKFVVIRFSGEYMSAEAIYWSDSKEAAEAEVRRLDDEAGQVHSPYSYWVSEAPELAR